MDAQKLLTERFGLAGFRPGQREVIEALERDRAALAVFPTGGGKSLCYQLPALSFEGVTVVVSPLIALMKDQIDFLTRRGIAAARLDSSLSASEAFAVSDRLRDGTLKILYVAPERFNNERFIGTLQKTPIALFAVDEAHCISEWGHNFRPDYLKLAETARRLHVQRVLALTATATPAVVADICAAFAIPQAGAVVTGFYRPNLDLATTPVTADERDAVLLKRLRGRPPGTGIIYVTLQKTAERVAALVTEAGLDARAYHAGMDADVRTAVQEWWKDTPDALVVATIAFGMGIDKADVRYVYHYNLPKSLESYSQEIGRAGRDDERSVVEMLACADDVPILENFAYGDTPTEGAVRGLLDELLSAGDEFDLNLFDLTQRHDIRQLVLRTLMTYLELRGVLRQGTPFYAGYEVQPLIPLTDIFAHFKGEPAQFIEGVFAQARAGKKWYALNPDEVAAALGQERRRVVRALEYLEEHGWAEVRASDVRSRYTRASRAESVETLTAELMERFTHREAQEVTRLRQVLDLVTHDGCQTNLLVAHFGEVRSQPCGHCTHCKTGQARTLPPPRRAAPLPDGLDLAAWQTLRQTHPGALGAPRQAARFLCGLTSPALTRAKLARHSLFGTWERHRFSGVLAWCEDV